MKFFFCLYILALALPCSGQDRSVPEFSSHDPSIHKKGKLQIPPAYLNSVPFENELGQVILKDSLDEKVKSATGFINSKGKFIIPPVYVKAERSSYGIIALLKENNTWEFYRPGTGMVNGINDIQNYSVVSLRQILFMKNNKWGIIIFGKNSMKVIDPVYKSIDHISANQFKLDHFNEWTLKNKSKDSLLSFACDKLTFMEEPFLYYEINGAGGVIDYAGKEVPAEELRKKRRSKAVMGTAPDEEQMHLPAIYELIELGSHLSKGSKNDKYILPDSTGKKIMLEFDSIQGPYENHFFVYNNGLTGIVDDEGNVCSEPVHRYEKTFPFKEGRAKIMKAGRYGFIDRKGNVRVAPQYSSVRDFKEGLAAVVINGKWGFIDKDENIIVQPYYVNVSDFSNGVAKAQTGSKWSFVTCKGEKLDNAYDDIREGENEKWIIIRNKKTGLADKNGKELLAPRYEALQDLENGMVIVKKGEKWGVVDYKENFVFPIVFDYVTFNRKEELFLFMKKGKEEILEIQSESGN